MTCTVLYLHHLQILQYWLLQDNQDCTLGLTSDSALEPFDVSAPALNSCLWAES
jgi:hypothetical protein